MWQNNPTIHLTFPPLLQNVCEMWPNSRKYNNFLQTILMDEVGGEVSCWWDNFWMRLVMLENVARNLARKCLKIMQK